MSSLRRTALQRKTQLRRTPMPRAAKSTAGRVKKTIQRQQQTTHPDTDPTAAQRRTVTARAGWRCEICGTVLGWPDGSGGTWCAPHSFHHRRPRGMGGTTRPDANSPANLLLLCGTGTTGCHGRVEANRAAAHQLGWLLHQTEDPTQVPAYVVTGPHREARPLLLTTDGRYEEPTR